MQVDEYGADALRFALLTGGAHGLDLNYDERRVLRARNFTTKLWNIGRLLEQQIDAAPADFHVCHKQFSPSSLSIFLSLLSLLLLLYSLSYSLSLSPCFPLFLSAVCD